MVDSRNKGARFERQLSAIFNENGFATRRGQACIGEPDVLGLPGIHVEAKHREKMALYDWMEQSIRDAKEGEMPCVFHKKNHADILVTMRLEDWMQMYKEMNNEL